ncbi:hypothetical protein [Neobacillus sp. LXY-4]|uniref:hypothetical protein n=1 Tax=Neobacillus sp. LXY-4 TaxID=3379826 RepID=UPI003EDF8926
MNNRFHACATCVHFKMEKKQIGMKYFCGRLGYSTQPNYQFQCWTPKEHVQRLMEKGAKDQGGQVS